MREGESLPSLPIDLTNEFVEEVARSSIPPNDPSRNTHSGSAMSLQALPIHQPRTEIRACKDSNEVEALFDRYQRHMAMHMPFVVLPANVTATSLSRSEPFLTRAILVVASFQNTTRQQTMAKDLLRDLFERRLINGEKTLGLLQGLLIFINWYNPHLYSPSNSTNLLHLAIALTTDLNIDLGPGTCEKSQIDAAAKAYTVSPPTKKVTNDERRAVLGTFYLASVIFNSFRKVNALHWTLWLENCAKALSETPEFETDLHLVRLVRMQRIMQEALTVEYNDAPIQFFADSFVGDLDKLGPLTSRGTTSTVVRLQDASTRVAIWQRSFVGLTSDKIDSNVLRRRLDGMWRFMEAVKAYFDIYLAMSVEEYPVVSFTVFAQFAYVFVVVIRALTIEAEGWNVSTLRGVMDFSAIMDGVSQRYESVSHVRIDGQEMRTEAFAKWAARIRWAKAYHDTRLTSTMPKTQYRGGSTSVTDDVNSTASIQYLPLPSPIAVEASLDPLLSFDEFWNDFNDPSNFSSVLGPTFGDL